MAKAKTRAPEDLSARETVCKGRNMVTKLAAAGSALQLCTNPKIKAMIRAASDRWILNRATEPVEVRPERRHRRTL